MCLQFDVIAQTVSIAREAKSRLLTMTPTDHDQTYDKLLAVSTRFLSAVNYGANEALPIFSRHPASSSSSASTGRSYQAPSSFHRPPFTATFPTAPSGKGPPPSMFVSPPSCLGAGTSTSMHFTYYTILLCVRSYNRTKFSYRATSDRSYRSRIFFRTFLVLSAW